MSRLPAPLAVALAALAGFVDAVVFTRLGGFFAASAGATTVRLGTGIGGGDGAARWAGALLLGFVAGAMVSAVLARRFARAPLAAALIAVAALLAAAAAADLMGGGAIALLLCAVAMGAQGSAGLREGGAVGVGVAAATVALAGAADRLAAALMGDGDRWGWLPGLVLAGGFLAGAVWGARIAPLHPATALTFAAAGAAAIAAAAAAHARPRTRRVKIVE